MGGLLGLFVFSLSLGQAAAPFVSIMWAALTSLDQLNKYASIGSASSF